MEKIRNIYIVLFRENLAGWIVSLIILVYVLLLLLAGGYAYFITNWKEVIRCSNYRTQTEAQDAYLTDISKYSALDRGSDGLACEDLPDK